MKRSALDPSSRPAAVESVSVERLGETLDTTDLAINHYRVPPEGRLPAGLHAHMDQEELFIVLQGEATFETLDGPIGVSTDEVIRFAPGEFQAGRNAGREPLAVLAIGAPRGSDDVRIPIDCPSCGHENLRLDFTDSVLTLECPDCAEAWEPDDCPNCDGDDLRVTLGDDDEPVVSCQTCDGSFDRPPVRGSW